jgi:hypothetical protein
MPVEIIMFKVPKGTKAKLRQFNVSLDHDDFSTYRRHEREVIPFLSPRR